jgi:hypothetical protein
LPFDICPLEFTALNVTLVGLNVSVPFLMHIFLREDGRQANSCEVASPDNEI